LEDLSVDERVILKWIVKKLVVGLDWLDLARGRESWRAPVLSETYLQVY
jgi:hypothetical protein